MADRIAPDGGYDFPQKRHYRRNVWASFREGMRKQRYVIADSHALLMPSIEGEEIEVGLNAGFRERNLHVVDNNPAIVATLKRRYPQINAYGVSAAAAVARIGKSGVRLRAANFDFCGCGSAPFFSELQSIVAARAFDSIAYVAVTMLRGREKPAVTEEFSELSGVAASTAERLQLVRSWMSRTSFTNERDASRAMAVGLRLAGYGDGGLIEVNKTCLVRGDSYKSTAGNQTMLWSLWQVVNTDPRVDNELLAQLRAIAKTISHGSSAQA